MDEPDSITELTRTYLDSGQVPQKVFRDADIYERELEHLFGRSWLFVGHTSEVPDNGDYARRYLGNDQFVFCRDESGQIQVLFNSCRHRGTRVCEAEQGNASHFRCPYHGWTYRNDGELVGVPDRETTYEDFDTAEWGLARAPRVDTYRGLVFACLDPDVEPLEEFLGDVTWYLDGHFDLIEGGLEVVGEPQRWRMATNWKIPVENNSTDTYHVQIAHRSIIEITFKKENESAPENSHFEVVDVGDGHSAIYRLYTDEFVEAAGLDDRVYFYPESVRAHLDETVEDAHVDLARKATVAGGRIFPNTAFIRGGGRRERGQDDVDFFLIFNLRPVAPDEAEMWYWILAPARASEAYKRRVYRVATMHDGTSGMAQMDDTAVLRGVADSAGGYFADHEDAPLNYRQGHAETLDPDWPGPGEAYTHHSDAPERGFYREWSGYLADEESP